MVDHDTGLLLRFVYPIDLVLYVTHLFLKVGHFHGGKAVEDHSHNDIVSHGELRVMHLLLRLSRVNVGCQVELAEPEGLARLHDVVRILELEAALCLVVVRAWVHGE